MKKNQIFFIIYSISFLLFFQLNAVSQVATNDTITDDQELHNDSIKVENDTIIDTKRRISPDAIESKITYSAKDSIFLDASENKIYLFGDVEIYYEDIELKAAYVEIDFDTRILFATWALDTSENIIGKPVFEEKDNSFDATEIHYNFKTKKGLIKNIFSEEAEAYLHGDVVKKMPVDVIFIKDGSFTTCPNPEDPHFEIKFTKAKVITDDKIITGPVWMAVEHVPLPILFPFGYFPNKKGQQSGLLIPSYGESANRGFFIENGGYYLGISDYVDIALRSDIYSRGSWAAKAQSNYKKRYKFNGYFNANYAVNKLGEPETPDFTEQRDFFINWKHAQDPKAHPIHKFNADVSFGTSDYSRFNPSSAQDYLSSNLSSSISYSARVGSIGNFSATLRQDQNKQTNVVNMTLPDITFSTTRFQPLRRKNITGKIRLYENINISYVMNARNTITTTDTNMFNNLEMRNFSNGFRHNIPISSSVKLLKHFTLTNTINYTGRWYFRTISKDWDYGENKVATDTISGFKTNSEVGFSSQLNTRIYGMFQVLKGPVTAVRHVLTPSLSFNYRPDFARSWWGYYDQYYSPSSPAPIRYSIFEGGIFGFPPAGESGMVQLALANNIEMKVRNRKDTVNKEKKIVLIENLTVRSSYDIAKDSLNWSNMFVDGRTRLFKDIDLRYAVVYDPYIIDSTGRNLNQFEWDINNRLFRKSQTEWATSINWNINSNIFSKEKNNKTESQDKKENLNNTIPLVSYEIPWNLRLSYTLQYSKNYDNLVSNDKQFIQTLSFSGDISLTPNWKFSFMSGYDFINKDFSYTSVNIHRDLHCWEMIFNWIPTGFRKSYNFTLRVKAPMLQDVKVEKKTDWRDYY